MTESTTTMNDNPNMNERAPMNHQPKKKRPDEPLPPDIGLKPVQLQRRRVWRACESCRRKKIKCDGVEPTCSQCAASKSQCTWLQTKDRAALSRHYVQELEARLLHMESIFQQVAPILEQLGQSGTLDLANLTSNVPPSSTNPTPPVTLQSLLNKGKEGIVVPSHADVEGERQIKMEEVMVEAQGNLALDEYGHGRWIGGSSIMSLIQSFKNLTTNPLHRISPMEEDPLAPGPSANKIYFPASVFFGKVRALPHPEEVEYPERDLADKLVDAYFTRFHFLMPVIDKPSFLRQYRHLMDNTKDVQLARSKTAFIALVCAVFACAARLVDDPRLSKGENLDDAGMGMVYYERALIMHYISHASMQVDHVQCLILMASFLCSVNCLPQAWLLVGQAIRSAQDLGLHRSQHKLPTVTPIDRETRKKVFWGCYTLDRMLALALGRPLGIEDTDCDVELPGDCDDEHLPEWFQGAVTQEAAPSLMQGFIQFCNLYKIAGRVLRQVYALDKCRDHLEMDIRAELNRSVETLDKELTKWCDDLPIAFKSNPVTEAQVSMGAVLCSHYYSILTTLHRNFLPVKRDAPVWPRSTAKAVSTARACIRLAPSIKNVVPPCHHLAFFIQNLFSSAVIILLYAMHTPDTTAAQTAMEESRSCLGVLESWEGHWPGAKKCKELLEDLASTASEAIKAYINGQTRPAPPGPSNPPASPTSAIPERRMSAPMLGSIPMAGAGDKQRQRRNRSRDVRISPHHRTPSYRHDPLSQRARSTSRKRPVHEENEFQEFGNPSLASMLSSSYPNRSTISAHSSPVSAHSHPSPPNTVLDHAPESNQSVMSASTFGLSIPQSPTSQGPSTNFDYDFGLSHSPTENRWHGPNDGTGFMGSEGFNNNSFPPQTPTIDTSYLTYPSDLSMGFPGLSTTPPSAGFAGPGLPFRGLDYIRNYNNPAGYPLGGNDQEQLWQTFDPNAFVYDPVIPFTLGELSSVDETAEQSQHWSNGQQQ